MECIICLNDISFNDYIITECCKQIIHIECLKSWVYLNIHKNSEINMCFYCKSDNEYINNLIYSININIDCNDNSIRDSSGSESNTNTNIDIDSDIIVHNRNIINNYHIMKPYILCCKICSIILIVMLCFCLFFI